MEETKTYLIEKREKANSYEFGKASNRFKLFFDTAEDLKALIDSLKEQGFSFEEETND
jgi:predicted dienelactone hydrolase